MAEFLEHSGCDACGSSDALANYDDGGTHCFSCGVSTRGSGEPNEHKPRAKREPGKFISGETVALAKRGISEQTCKHFGYQVGDYKGKRVHIAPLYVDNQLVAQKLRDSAKNFMVISSGDVKLPLFGQNKWREGGRKLVITEGEIDCMSISQLQGNKWPVVSVPNGAQGAKRAIANAIDFVNGYEQVVFAFDMDEPGQAAARECASMLAPGKAYIATLPLKDANECLQRGVGDKLIQCIWDARAYRPDGMVGVSDIRADAINPIVPGSSWPWASLTKATHGRRRGELYGFGGGTGCGKSTLFKQVAMHIIENEDLKVGMMMLEEPPRLTLRTLGGMMIGSRTHVPGVHYDPAELGACYDKLEDKVYFYDHVGSSGWETIKEKIRYMVHAEGIKDIFLDHLTAVAASIADVDERKAIDKIMAELSSLTQELDCTIYYISHLTTPDSTPHEEGGRVLEKQFRGSRSIAYWSHFLFGIERDKQDLEGVTTFRVLKDRYTGDSNGYTMGLKYDMNTGRLNECPIPAPKKKSDGSEFDKVNVGDF